MAASSTSNRRKSKNPRKRTISGSEPEEKSYGRKRRKRQKVDHVDGGDPGHQRFRVNIAKQRIETATTPLEYPFDESRIIQSHDEPSHGVPVSSTSISGVMYWMQRDQRVQVEHDQDVSKSPTLHSPHKLCIL